MKKILALAILSGCVADVAAWTGDYDGTISVERRDYDSGRYLGTYSGEVRASFRDGSLDLLNGCAVQIRASSDTEATLIESQCLTRDGEDATYNYVFGAFQRDETTGTLVFDLEMIVLRGTAHELHIVSFNGARAE